MVIGRCSPRTNDLRGSTAAQGYPVPKRLVAFSTFAYQRPEPTPTREKVPLGPPWIIVLVAVAAFAAAFALWAMRARKPAGKPLPTEWALTARPVFSTDERRVYRQLREALPHHILLSKLPLVRFCQPDRPARGALLVRAARLDPRDVRDMQRQRPRARGHRSRHRSRQFATSTADQASRCSVPAACGICAARWTTCRRSPNCSCSCRSSGATRGPQPAPARNVHNMSEAVSPAG